jgi:hypothetical protein
MGDTHPLTQVLALVGAAQDGNGGTSVGEAAEFTSVPRGARLVPLGQRAPGESSSGARERDMYSWTRYVLLDR